MTNMIQGDPLHVLQLIDTLEPGGAESVAVMLSNELAALGHRVTLATTRKDGALSTRVSENVGRLCLQRRHRYDWRALGRLRAFIRAEAVEIIHSHSTSVFAAVASRGRRSSPPIVWHDHLGTLQSEPRSPLPYRLIRHRVAAVIAVTRELASWSEQHLGLDRGLVTYIPNFVDSPPEKGLIAKIPGSEGRRLICVANFRRQKDHPNLLRAFASLPEGFNDWHLLLVGEEVESSYREEVEDLIARLNLQRRIHLLGPRPDVPAILERCDVGALPSQSEGLPLALLEYGRAGLPVVATDVGEIREVLDGGLGGVIVPRRDSYALRDGLATVLADEQLRGKLGIAFCQRVARRYSSQAALSQILDTYRQAERTHS
jgi:glycosyltransferase involved in cell wall biosynthesis